MHQKLLKAFQIFEADATLEDMRDACRNLFLGSTEYHATLQPFDRTEVDAVANAIYEFILDPDNPLDRKIVFNSPRRLEGQSMGYYEYAKMFSEDMLYENIFPPVDSLDLKELRLELKTFLVAIFFRYQACIEARWFPVSLLLDFFDVVKELFSREQRESELCNAVLTTLDALRSLEPVHRMEQ